MLNLNIYAAFRSVHAVLPYMMERKTGEIVFTSSVAGVVLVVWEPIYTASKFEDPAGSRPREDKLVLASEEPVSLGAATLGLVAVGPFPDLGDAMTELSRTAEACLSAATAITALHASRHDAFKHLQEVARELR